VAGLAAAVLAAVLLWPRPAGVTTGPAAEATDNSVAVLLRAPGAVWGETDVSTRVGAPLRAGWLRLKSGHAHIEFYSGATVILEGPAELQLVSRSEAFCSRGKLRASVPQQAQGFTITTPTLDLVDRGTEFGLTVGVPGGPGDHTEVHVFQGKVEVHETGPNRQTELTTGEGVRVDGAGAARSIPADPTGFLTAQALAERSTKQTLLRHQDWLTASAALRWDPSLVAYYTFQPEPDQSWTRTLFDQAGDRRQAHDGAIVGCEWSAGRWPGKRGLEFKQVSDRVRVHVPGAFQSLTLAAWVRVDALPNVNNSLLMSDAWKDGGVHWQIGEAGKLVLGIQGPGGKNGAHYHAHDVFTPERFGTWVHLAVVYDRDAGRVTHYVDGQPAAAPEPTQFDIPLRIHDAEIGNWNLASHRNNCPVRFFSGCMDELMLFSRALSDADVERLCKQGRPLP
jgi:hypothetical protein